MFFSKFQDKLIVFLLSRDTLFLPFFP